MSDDWKKDYEHGFDDAICHVRELLYNRLNGEAQEGGEGEVWIVRTLLNEVNGVHDLYAQPGETVARIRDATLVRNPCDEPREPVSSEGE